MAIILKNSKTSLMISAADKKITHILLVVCGLVLFQESRAQGTVVENSVFWEVTGKDLSEPSYLFGTFHLMGSRYVDSLTNVTDKFAHSKTVVSELLFDSTMTVRMMMAARMKDTTLTELLSPELYQQTSQWMKELSGYDLRFFDSMNPMTIQILLMTMLQQRYYPLHPALDVPMDLYFQKTAAAHDRKLVGLETFEDQIFALYGQFSYKRQAELLQEYVLEKDKAKDEVIRMNQFYREGNLSGLQELITSQNMSEREINTMADNRNKRWMEQLPALIKEQSSFVAVGALHLPGENGLVSLLRKSGYTVKPLALKL